MVKVLWTIGLIENSLVIIISPNISYYIIKWTTAFRKDFNFTIKLSKMYIGIIKTLFLFYFKGLTGWCTRVNTFYDF